MQSNSSKLQGVDQPLMGPVPAASYMNHSGTLAAKVATEITSANGRASLSEPAKTTNAPTRGRKVTRVSRWSIYDPTV